MQELKIEIQKIDPLEIFGVNNAKLKYIQKYFPDIEIMARGKTLTAKGEKLEVDIFENKWSQLITFFKKYKHLSENDIDNLMTEDPQDVLAGDGSEIIIHGTRGKKIKGQSLNQRKLVEAVNSKDMVFAVGPAGTGKTYTAVALAVRALKNREVKRIILTRPAVEAGENLGFLPGDLKEKLDPYMMPLYDALRDMIPSEKLTEYIESSIIEIAPLAFMRGRTLDNAFVILDEAQNTTVNQMRMFLTRMGKNASFVINGDISQIDLPNKQRSGLIYALDVLKNIEDIGLVHLNENDVIRHKLVKQIIKAFDEDKNKF